MILSFRDKRTAAFANSTFVPEFQGFDRQAWKRLEILDAATNLEDLRALPSNRLEALKGNRDGQFTIRINMQWRICFEWPKHAPGPSNVEIVDYHWKATKLGQIADGDELRILVSVLRGSVLPMAS
jgi:proteic killer suppression protein